MATSLSAVDCRNGGFCAFDEEVIVPLKAFQRAHNLRVTPSLTAETVAKLREVAAASP